MALDKKMLEDLNKVTREMYPESQLVEDENGYLRRKPRDPVVFRGLLIDYETEDVVGFVDSETERAYGLARMDYMFDHADELKEQYDKEEQYSAKLSKDWSEMTAKMKKDQAKARAKFKRLQKKAAAKEA
jgi:hypothetical protein